MQQALAEPLIENLKQGATFSAKRIGSTGTKKSKSKSNKVIKGVLARDIKEDFPIFICKVGRITEQLYGSRKKSSPVAKIYYGINGVEIETQGSIYKVLRCSIE